MIANEVMTVLAWIHQAAAHTNRSAGAIAKKGIRPTCLGNANTTPNPATTLSRSVNVRKRGSVFPSPPVMPSTEDGSVVTVGPGCRRRRSAGEYQSKEDAAGSADRSRSWDRRREISAILNDSANSRNDPGTHVNGCGACRPGPASCTIGVLCAHRGALPWLVPGLVFKTSEGF